jgi:hypothetical protein
MHPSRGHAVLDDAVSLVDVENMLTHDETDWCMIYPAIYSCILYMIAQDIISYPNRKNMYTKKCYCWYVCIRNITWNYKISQMLKDKLGLNISN